MYYVKYYNTLCNNDIIESFTDMWEAKRCKDMNDGEFVTKEGEPKTW